VKAFLSHSTADAELVHSVAKRIGRALVTVDVRAFHSANEITESIESAVRDSAVFVLFASRNSLSSDWVKFEIDEARYHRAMTRLKKLVVVILDERLSAEDFPEWMRRSVFLRSRAAGPIARAIRGAIDELVADAQGGFYVGRAQETVDLQAAVVPLDTSADIHVVAVRGLPGIGRRALLQRVLRDSMHIERLLTLRLEPGDSVQSVAIKLADLVEPCNTADESLDLARSIAALSNAEAGERFAEDARLAFDSSELVVLYDEGGLLDDDGLPTVATSLVVVELLKRQDCLIALVTNRRANLEQLSHLHSIPVVEVRPLKAMPRT
jgi:hypothetical protein